MEKEKNIVVTTAWMGSCQCGDCYCAVWEDGTIQYQGNESWQRSERRMPFRDSNGCWTEPRRHYNSELMESAYKEAMRLLAKQAVKKNS